MKSKRVKAVLHLNPLMSDDPRDWEWDWELHIGRRLAVVHEHYFKSKQSATRAAERAAVKLNLEIVPAKGT